MKLFHSRRTIMSLMKYFLVGATVFAIGLVYNFPLVRLSDTLLSFIERQTGYRVTVDDLDFGFPLAVVAKGFRLQKPAPLPLEFEYVRLAPAPVSLLTYPLRKTATVAYAAEQAKNRWEGHLGLGPEKMSFTLETDGWRIARSFPLGGVNLMLQGSELKLTTKASLDLELSGTRAAIEGGNFAKANGRIDLKTDRATLEAALLKQIRFDQIQLQGELQEGKLAIDSLTLTGPDITGEMKGTITVAPYFMRSQMQLDANLTLTEKVQHLRDLITTFGAQEGIRLDETGKLALKITGRLDRPRFRSY